MINRLCIIGVGLIGGSLALAAKKSGYCQEVIGVGRNQENLDLAIDLGVIDSATQDAAEGVQEADMVMLSVPVGVTESVCRQIAGSIPERAILTDGGSVKGSVVDQVRSAFGGKLPKNFVPGHPIAGTEKSGAGAAFAELYIDRRILLTPTEETSSESTAEVQAMWEATGAIVEIIGVEHHDRVLAATSHLPHMLAYGLVDSLAKQEKSEEIFRYAAGGFKDFTRIASSDPTMWRDICIHNRESILNALSAYEQDLREIHTAIRDSDEQALHTIFTRAKAARDNLSQE